MNNTVNQQASDRLFPGQKGVIFQLTAKPGKRDELFDRCLIANAENNGDRILCMTDEMPDTLWGFAFFRDDSTEAPKVDATMEALMEGSVERHDVRIEYSGRVLKGSLLLDPTQPGTVLRFIAKPGKGDALFDLTNRMHYEGDPDGPTDWILCKGTM